MAAIEAEDECFELTGKSDRKKIPDEMQRFLLCQPRVKRALQNLLKQNVPVFVLFCFLHGPLLILMFTTHVQNLLIRTIVFRYIHLSISCDPLNTRKFMLQSLTRVSPSKAYFQWFRKWLVTREF